MRLGLWVVSGLSLSTIVAACSDPEKSDGSGAHSGGAAVAGAGASSGGKSAQGGSSGGSGGSNGGGGEARSFLDELWSAYCKQLMTCAIPNDDAIGQRLYLGTEARCLEAIRELRGEEPPIRDLLAKLEAGSIRFVAEHAQACLAEAADCIWQGRFSNGPACRAVFEGSVPTTGECRRWEDCTGEAYCDHSSGCPGHCAPLGEPGAACETNAECKPGNGYAFCDRSGTQPLCKRLPIGARAGLGAPCTVLPAQVSELVLCENALWCDPGDGSSATGTCRSPITEGGACKDPDDVCAGAAACSDGAHCTRVKIVRAEREACDQAAQSYCDSFAGLVCVSGTCQRPGDGSQGSACKSSDILERVTCAHGLYCNRIDEPLSETCAPLLGANAPCRSNDECASAACATTCAESYCDG